MKIIRTINRFAKNIGDLIPEWTVALSIRIGLFFIFWNAVQHKLYGFSFLNQHLAFWNVSDATLMQFEFQYNLPFIPATLAAYLATFAEFFFSIGLLLGLFSRISALGLIILVVVIQVFVRPEHKELHL